MMNEQNDATDNQPTLDQKSVKPQAGAYNDDIDYIHMAAQAAEKKDVAAANQNSENIEQGSDEYLAAEPVIEDESSELYRKSALEKLGMHEQSDALFLPINNKIWVVWGVNAFLLLCAMAWLLFGSVPILVEGAGIFMSKEGLFSIQSTATGVVEEIFVAPGDVITKGSLVARIEDPKEKFAYDNIIAREKKLVENLLLLKEQVQAEAAAEKDALNKQIAAEESAIKELSASIVPLEKDLQLKEELLNQNLISLNDLQSVRQLLSQRKIALETSKSNLVKFQTGLSKTYRENEINDKETALLQIKQEREIAAKNRQYNLIESPDDGRLLELLVSVNSFVSTGMPLMHLEYLAPQNSSNNSLSSDNLIDNQQSGNEYVVYAFVPLDIGKKIKIGTRAEIEPSTVSAQEYGAIIGRIAEVSSYSVSKQNIANLIQNSGLVDFLTKNNPSVIQLLIIPEIDAHNPSGFKWTSSNGPPIKISTGTVCEIKAIVDRTTPLFYFFSLPWLQSLISDL